MHHDAVDSTVPSLDEVALLLQDRQIYLTRPRETGYYAAASTGDALSDPDSAPKGRVEKAGVDQGFTGHPPVDVPIQQGRATCVISVSAKRYIFARTVSSEHYDV